MQLWLPPATITLPKRFTTTRVHLPTRYCIAEKKLRQDFQHIVYRTFGTSVVLKMPACPDRIRISTNYEFVFNFPKYLQIY